MQTKPKALILAAGQGTRLRPLTDNCPKPMVSIGDRPLLSHTITWLARHGIVDIAINLNYRPDVITAYFGDGKAWDVNLTYSYEDPVLGTAGAVRKLHSYLADAPFVVVYGDVLTDLDLTAFWRYHLQKRSEDPATVLSVSLYAVPNPTEVGLVDLDDSGKIRRFVEKPPPEEVFTDLANAGIFVVQPEVIDMIPENTFYDFGHDLFPRLLAGGYTLYGWPVPKDTYLLDIGTLAKYEQAQREWPRINEAN